MVLVLYNVTYKHLERSVADILSESYQVSSTFLMPPWSTSKDPDPNAAGFLLEGGRYTLASRQGDTVHERKTTRY